MNSYLIDWGQTFCIAIKQMTFTIQHALCITKIPLIISLLFDVHNTSNSNCIVQREQNLKLDMYLSKIIVLLTKTRVSQLPADYSSI